MQNLALPAGFQTVDDDDEIGDERTQLCTGCFFFTGPPLKKTKSKIMLEYPDWASPGPLQKVKVHGLGLP